MPSNTNTGSSLFGNASTQPQANQNSAFALKPSVFGQTGTGTTASQPAQSTSSFFSTPPAGQQNQQNQQNQQANQTYSIQQIRFFGGTGTSTGTNPLFGTSTTTPNTNTTTTQHKHPKSSFGSTANTNTANPCLARRVPTRLPQLIPTSSALHRHRLTPCLAHLRILWAQARLGEVHSEPVHLVHNLSSSQPLGANSPP